MSRILYTDVREAYEASDLTPCRCGPEWHRLAGGKIGGGPFMALYCQASWLIVTADMSDAALDALADAAERWARREWGTEYYAAFQAGFEHCDTLNLIGVSECTFTERLGLFEGSVAGRQLEAVPAPPLTNGMLSASFYTCNGSPKGCERSRFGQCGHHDQRKADALC